jgi:hypothetical protein
MSTTPITSSESKIRLTAFFVLVLILTYLVTRNAWVILFLLADFSLRASPELAYLSPLAAISGLLRRALRLPVKPVYMPPKRFAARIGLLFILALIVFHQSDIATLLLGATVALFAALESLAGFCAGCWVYNVFMRLRSH